MSEVARRLPAFIGGTPVRLLDGQVWFLARPRVVTDVLALPSGPAPYPRLTLGDPELDPVYERLVLRQPVQNVWFDPEHFLNVAVPAAALLLRVNYDLSDAECRRLLVPAGLKGPEDLPALLLADQEWLAPVVLGILKAATQSVIELGEAVRRLPYRTTAGYLTSQPGLN